MGPYCIYTANYHSYIGKVSIGDFNDGTTPREQLESDNSSRASTPSEARSGRANGAIEFIAQPANDNDDDDDDENSAVESSSENISTADDKGNGLERRHADILFIPTIETNKIVTFKQPSKPSTEHRLVSFWKLLGWCYQRIMCSLYEANALYNVVIFG